MRRENMSQKLTLEQLNEMSKESLVSMALSMQDKVDELNSKMDYLIG